jgi:hypothetical protein
MSHHSRSAASTNSGRWDRGGQDHQDDKIAGIEPGGSLPGFGDSSAEDKNNWLKR